MEKLVNNVAKQKLKVIRVEGGKPSLTGERGGQEEELR